MATKKAAAKANKVELTQTIEKVKETAKSVNAQIMETTSEVIEDVVKSGKEVATEVTETAKKTIKEFDVNKGLNKVKETAKKVNTGAIQVAETLVDETLETGKEWQGVAEKAIKGSLKLAEKQQDILFDTLEAVKGQMLKSANRFRDLFSKN